MDRCMSMAPWLHTSSRSCTTRVVTSLYIGEKNLTISDLSIIQTMAIIFTNIGIFCCNFKILSFSNRITSAISVLGISLCMLILSFLHSFIFYILIYGLLYGFFIGFGYMAPLKNCYDHLPNRKGMNLLIKDFVVGRAWWGSVWELFSSILS
jgi:sugar phosphate permease